MPTEMDRFALWRCTLADQPDGLDQQRAILRHAFLSFRERTAQLVNEIGALLPQLTVHDVTHLDALWRVAAEIAGPNYEVNPAEAFVLGGAFLLHDAAHVLAAYDDGLAGIKRGPDWQDLIAHRFDGAEPEAGSPDERLALFQILRHLHAKQARQLPNLSWKIPSSGQRIHLLEAHDLRVYYGDVIGEIAESHHWPPHRVAETFEHRYVDAPALLAPASWTVDVLKVAFLLRTADAAHIDGARAPWFLFALRRPDGISQSHWHFQAKMGQPRRTARAELRLSSGSPFRTGEQQAWWLAYETACMIDRELRAADAFMRDADRAPFAARCVEHVSTPEAFVKNVPTSGWEPVNVAPKIGNAARLIATLGGAALYGNHPELALRELIQNAADAVRALRALGGIEEHEGRIEVSLTRDADATWLNVTDTGIGMSRFVLTEVLLDFGNSLWNSESLTAELPGLAAREFKAVGQFGIGFFAIFMLGRRVRVTTRRFRRALDEDGDQWSLEFNNGLDERPTLRRPSRTDELPRPGTRVSVAIDSGTLARLHTPRSSDHVSNVLAQLTPESERAPDKPPNIETDPKVLARVVASLCPTLNVEIGFHVDAVEHRAVRPDDWQKLTPSKLLSRLYAKPIGQFVATRRYSDARLVDLREDTGLLVGRVSYDKGFFSHAVTTHCGISNGSVPGLVGVLLSHNNTDLMRKKSAPLASRGAWRRWAEQWINSAQIDDAQVLADMHPFLPEHDLAIYFSKGQWRTEAQLSAWLKSQSEIFTCAHHYDLSGEHPPSISFGRKLKSQQRLVIFPGRNRHRLAAALGFEQIDYARRLHNMLRTAWGEFEPPSSRTIPTKVSGIAMSHIATRYTRRSRTTRRTRR